MEDVIKNKKEMKRVKTYIEGLDNQLQGGVPEGYITLISGTSGTMKSSLAFYILYNEARQNKNIGVYLSLEQSANSLLNQMVNLDLDSSKINLVTISDITKISQELGKVKPGTIIMIDISAIRKKIKETKIGPSGDWLNAIKNIANKVKEKGSKLFVLDSLSALYTLSKFEQPRANLFFMFEFLRNTGMTCFLISEMPLDKSKYGEYEIESFMVDGVILLQLTERYRKVIKEIAIVKMRATDCNTDIFTFEFKNGKFHALYGGKAPLV